MTMRPRPCTRRGFIGGGLSFATGMMPVLAAEGSPLPAYYDGYLDYLPAGTLPSHPASASTRGHSPSPTSTQGHSLVLN